ncbi:MAG: STAS domain-containing protein [Terriglobales bacterium]
MEINRPVVVKRLPERLNMKLARAFCREMEPILNSDRPQVVLDCSQVQQIDAAGVEMLLQCLARVMKRDGDVKLAALSPQIAVVLEMTRTERLFEIYETSSDAVLSFSRFLPAALKQPSLFLVPGFSQPANQNTSIAADGGSDLAA